MVKAIAYSVCAVLLISSAAFGQVGMLVQNQDWGHSASTLLDTSGAVGTVDALTAFGRLDTQDAESIYTSTTANQGVGALLVQAGTGTNLSGGSVSILQDTMTQGLAATSASGPGQLQMIGAYDGPAQQFEGVGLTAAQMLTTAGGGGEAQALNGAGLAIGQEAASTSMELAQSSFMAAVQAANVISDPGGQTTVSSGVVSEVLQGQSANTVPVNGTEGQ